MTLTTGTPVRRQSGIGLAQEDNMRHWSFTAFEWVVRDVQKLKEYVEDSEAPGSNSSEGGTFDVLKESPTLGDGKFKLEIVMEAQEAESTTPIIRVQHPSSLSLYITSVVMEFAHPDYEIYSSIFTGIKCQDDRVGERGARAEWVWEHWQNDWVFREDSEVWECPLPPLSTLLDNRRIKETDSFVICVQVHSPVGPFFPQQPAAAYVPRDLLDGLEASLDNSNTGDVQFICLERKEDSGGEETAPESPSTEVPVDPLSTSGSSLPPTLAVARKRIIYAHSDILKRRSEYFATMLGSSFSETTGETKPLGERKVYTIVVEEADFCTVYWLLKWVYANWTLFREQDDPKAAVDGVGAGWSARSLQGATGGADEWEWKAFSKQHDYSQDVGISDSRSIASLESRHSSGQKAKGKTKPTSSPNTTGPNTSVSAMRSTSNATLRQPPSPSKSTSNRPSASPTRRSTSGATPSNTGNQPSLAVPKPPSPSPSPSSPRSKAATLPVSPTTSNFPLPGGPHHPLSPRQQRQRSRPSATAVPDPHPHPTPAPPPSSALSMYQVAHRYAMPGLAALALEHMMSTITPQSSFALLLATSAWDELHALVEDYVVEKWDEVSVSSEFEQCCQEVAGGEWGAEGGKTMTALFRRLRSPSSLSFRT
ncbi:hypothetical protein BXZ70DRAFT_1001284 [Cristinia sonorae]|uniref:BTB domain-containing protein n=1 Tax=Cristinia sonorae TaxID=1940300 RepID=A0A8K0UJY2_9AGAR|nr:hypothetical protein BXZ70DRAFT_1001284 [Cristinia sonorae]